MAPSTSHFSTAEPYRSTSKRSKERSSRLQVGQTFRWPSPYPFIAMQTLRNRHKACFQQEPRPAKCFSWLTENASLADVVAPVKSGELEVEAISPTQHSIASGEQHLEWPFRCFVFRYRISWCFSRQKLPGQHRPRLSLRFPRTRLKRATDVATICQPEWCSPSQRPWRAGLTPATKRMHARMSRWCGRSRVPCQRRT